MNASALRTLVLRELEAYGDGITPEGLLALVQIKHPRAALADINETLGWLRDQDLAAFVADCMAPDDRALRRWAVTTKGRLSILQR